MTVSRPPSPPPTPPTTNSDDKGPLQKEYQSGLEVDHDRWVETDGKAAPMAAPDDKDEKIPGYSDVSKEMVVVDVHELSETSGSQIEQHRILGLKRKSFFIILPIVILVIIGIAVGAGVGASQASRKTTAPTSLSIPPTNTTSTASTTPSQTPTSTRGMYANTGIAAMQWTDLNGTLHKRIYYQDNKAKIRESSWDNSTDFKSIWEINAISDPVKPGTPVGAVAGYPHTSYNYSVVKNVYYMGSTGELYERQAPANDSQAWEDDNFSGLYSASNSTFMTAYWNQNIANRSQELVVVFQEEDFANGLTQGRYTSYNDTSNPWIANNFAFSQPKGSNFAMALCSYRSGRHLMLYAVDDKKNLIQHEYSISTTDLDAKNVVSMTTEINTGLQVEPRAPLAVVAQDNQPLYSQDERPECLQQTPLGNLIFYTAADRGSLILHAWNCTDGFMDHTEEIKPLQKANTTYLALTAMNDRVSGEGNLYIMFDSGEGPQMEEWTVPKRAGDPWVTSRDVTVDFDL